MAALEVDEEERVPTIDLLHPELLSKDGLLELMRQRQMSIEELRYKEKEVLVDIYYKTVLPMPQRKYRLNRRGREMTKKQVLLNKRKRRYEDMSGQGEGSQRNSGNTQSFPRFMTSFSGTPTGDRLKPPPSAINFARKTIKLGKKGSCEDKSVGDNNARTTSVIKFKSSSEKDAKEVKEATSTGVIKLTASGDSHNASHVRPGVIKSRSNHSNSNKHENTLTVVTPSKSSSTNKPQKIKLKRQSSSYSSSVIVNAGSSQTTTTITTPETPGKVTTCTTMEMQGGAELTNAEQKGDSSPGSTEEEVVKKKFRKIQVSWP